MCKEFCFMKKMFRSRNNLRKCVLFFVFYFLFSPVGAQTFTQRIQQQNGNGQGTVTIHQDADIDKLVNSEVLNAKQPASSTTPTTSARPTVTTTPSVTTKPSGSKNPTNNNTAKPSTSSNTTSNGSALGNDETEEAAGAGFGAGDGAGVAAGGGAACGGGGRRQWNRPAVFKVGKRTVPNSTQF